MNEVCMMFEWKIKRSSSPSERLEFVVAKRECDYKCEVFEGSKKR